MHNINLSTIRSFCSDDNYFNQWMDKPFIIDNDIYATDGKILVKFKGCVKDFPEITEHIDNPSKIINVFNDNPCGYIKISVDKLESLLNSINPVDEIVYEDKEVECDDCEGHGKVDFTYTSIDGELSYTTDTCPVCNGKGSLVKSIEVKTGKKIIPYETSYVDIYFEKYLYNTVNAELLHRIVEFCKQIDVSEFYFGIIDHTKMTINLNDYIEIAVSCCNGKCDSDCCENNLKYKN